VCFASFSFSRFGFGVTALRKRVSAGCLGAFVALAEVPVLAAEPENGMTSAQVITFDIPAQPLSSALERFMAMTNVAVVADSAMVTGFTSRPVHGWFSPEGALRSLLAGTGIDPQPIGTGTYALVSRPAATDRHSLPPFTDYAATIQQEVTRALCRHAETRPTYYRTVMRLWIDPTGLVERSELATSTGNPRLDLAIGASLRNLDIGAPVPIGLSQPVKLAILPRAEGEAACPPDTGRPSPASVVDGPGR
jgi:hypothetical protein